MNLISVGNGQLTLRGKPGRRFFEDITSLNLSRIITLLSEREGASELGQLVLTHDIQWTWIPLENAQYPTGDSHELLKANLPVISSYLDAGESILIHCAAGIHRTGMLAYAVLRYRGYSIEQAQSMIAEMRQHTQNGMHDKHFEWGEAVILELKNS